MEKVVTVGLIKGRHPLPVSEYIFESIENVLDFDFFRATINHFLEERVGIVYSSRPGVNQVSYDDVQCFIGEAKLIVYVTGLTACTAALIHCCALYGVNLTLMHFDSSRGEYVPQTLRFV